LQGRRAAARLRVALRPERRWRRRALEHAVNRSAPDRVLHRLSSSLGVGALAEGGGRRGSPADPDPQAEPSPSPSPQDCGETSASTMILAAPHCSEAATPTDPYNLGAPLRSPAATVGRTCRRVRTPCGSRSPGQCASWALGTSGGQQAGDRPVATPHAHRAIPLVGLLKGLTRAVRRASRQTRRVSRPFSQLPAVSMHNRLEGGRGRRLHRGSTAPGLGLIVSRHAPPGRLCRLARMCCGINTVPLLIFK